MSATLAQITSRIEFTARNNPLRIVSKRSATVWATDLGDGTYRIQIPQTGLWATATAATLHFTR